MIAMKRLKACGRRLWADRAGMTVVESIVAVLIIGIAAVMLLSAFAAATNIARRGADRELAGNQAYAGLESQAATVQSEPGELRFSVEGREYRVPGRYQTETVEENGAAVTYRSFVPD